MALQTIRKLGMRGRDTDTISKIEYVFMTDLTILIPEVIKFVRDRRRSRVERSISRALPSANSTAYRHDESSHSHQNRKCDLNSLQFHSG